MSERFRIDDPENPPPGEGVAFQAMHELAPDYPPAKAAAKGDVYQLSHFFVGPNGSVYSVPTHWRPSPPAPETTR